MDAIAESKPLLKKRKVNGARQEKDAPPSFLETLKKLQDEAEATGEVASAEETWPRPAVDAFDPRKNGVTFQQIDIEEHSNAAVPTIRIYGVTAKGNSVLVHVTGFRPYFFIAAPRGFEPRHCAEFRTHLNMLFGSQTVHEISLCKKKSLMNFTGHEDVAFLQITLTDPRQLSKIRGAMERGEISFKDLIKSGDQILTYENIAYTLRFMIDLKIVGMNWLEIMAGKYRVVKQQNQISRTQIELECGCVLFWQEERAWKEQLCCEVVIDASSALTFHSPDAIKSHAPDDEWSNIAPLRVLSFDIECAGRKGVFPEPQHDPVIQIASMVTRQGESAPFVKNVFTLNTCAPIVGSHVKSFGKEADMLEAWAHFVQTVDPDLVIGYNISNFDFPYLLDRAKVLKASKFPYLGRELATRTEAKDTHFSSKAFGTRDSKHTELQGRIQLDMLELMRRDHKLRSYSLNSVSFEFLGEQKEDVHFSLITELQNGGPEARRRLAVYCLKVHFFGLPPAPGELCADEFALPSS